MYTNAHGAESHLTGLGYYHFWVNHTYQYANDKFPFISTFNVELSWSNMKTSSQGIPY